MRAVGVCRSAKACFTARSIAHRPAKEPAALIVHRASVGSPHVPAALQTGVTANDVDVKVAENLATVKIWQPHSVWHLHPIPTYLPTYLSPTHLRTQTPTP